MLGCRGRRVPAVARGVRGAVLSTPLRPAPIGTGGGSADRGGLQMLLRPCFGHCAGAVHTICTSCLLSHVCSACLCPHWHRFYSAGHPSLSLSLSSSFGLKGLVRPRGQNGPPFSQRGFVIHPKRRVPLPIVFVLRRGSSAC